MKRFFFGTTLLLGLLLLIGGSATRVAQPQETQPQAGSLQVCPQGCSYQQIQAAADAARPGDEISVAPGIYPENLLITKPLTIAGTGSADQVVVTAKEPGMPTVKVLNPDRQPPGSLPLQVKLQSLTITGARRAVPFSPPSTSDPCAADPGRSCAGLYIESLQIYLPTPTGQIVTYSNAVHLTLVDIQVVRNELAGIEWQGQVDLVLLRSRINANGGSGIYRSLGGWGQVTLFDSEVSDNKLSGVHLVESYQNVSFRAVNSQFVGNVNGISVYGECGPIHVPHVMLRMEGVTVQKNHGSGISLAQSTAILHVSDSSIEENGHTGVVALSCSIGRPLVFISKVHITKNREAGILLEEEGLLELTESVVAENGRQSTLFPRGGPGIAVQSTLPDPPPGARAIVESNEILGNAGYGIMADHPESVIFCRQNKLSGNGLGNYNEVAAQKCK